MSMSLSIKQSLQKDSRFISTFTEQIISGLKSKSSLAKIPFTSKKYREFYLLLCKGSYQAKDKPILLLDYITYQKIEDSPSISFKAMSKPLLIAFFGEEITKKILLKEEENYFAGKATSALSENQLYKLLDNIDHEVHKKHALF